MTYTYTLDAEDFLMHQLFVASTSSSIQRRKRMAHIIWSALFFAFAGSFYLIENDQFLTWYTFSFGLLFLFFYPSYYKWRYKKHYQKHINENLSSRFGKNGNLNFLEEHIFTSNENGSESKFSHTSVSSIHETNAYYFIRLQGAQMLILPKAKIEQLDALKTDLDLLAQKTNLTIENNLNWKW